MHYHCAQCGGVSPLPAYAKGKAFRLMVCCPHCGRGGMSNPGGLPVEPRPPLMAIAPELFAPPPDAHAVRTREQEEITGAMIGGSMFDELFSGFGE